MSDKSGFEQFMRKYSIASDGFCMNRFTFAQQNIKLRLWQAVKILKGYWNFTTRSQRQVESQSSHSAKRTASFILSLSVGTRVINKYWIAISNNSHQIQSICADGLVFYIHRLWCKNITEGKEIKLYKDDVLIYTTAELLKENHSDLKDIDIKIIAYNIAEMFDRYF